MGLLRQHSTLAFLLKPGSLIIHIANFAMMFGELLLSRWTFHWEHNIFFVAAAAGYGLLNISVQRVLGYSFYPFLDITRQFALVWFFLTYWAQSAAIVLSWHLADTVGKSSGGQVVTAS